MFFSIVSDIPGRIRLRCGRHVFTEAEARGVSLQLMQHELVRTAQVHELNGSILLTYTPGPGNRETVLEQVRALDILALPAAEPGIGEDHTAVEMALETNRFQHRIAMKIVWRYLRKLLLPKALMPAFVILRAIPFVLEGLRRLLRGQLTVEVLDATAIVASMAQGCFSEAGTVMFLLDISSIMEDHVQSRVRLSLREGLVVRPENVWARVDGQDVSVNINDVTEGMVLHMTAGNVLPVDGVVTEGAGEVDEASLTGESLAVPKEEGSTVYAGTALATGDLLVRVTAAPGLSRIDNVAHMVEESSAFKADIQGRAEHLADAIVPYSFLAFFGILGITRNLTTAMSVLMVDYSCAIKLSTPIAVMSAMNEAARHGIVVRGGKFLEAAADADAIIFDKTGTLTHATPCVEKIITFGSVDEEELLRLTACIEEHFPHSMARAIVREARRRGLKHDREMHSEVKYVVAHGIVTSIKGNTVRVGSAHFLFDDEGVAMPENLLERIESEAPASSTVFISRNDELLGAICITDPPREEAAEVIADLRAHGFSKLIMLTGDAEGCARHIAGQLHLDGYRAQVLPEDKSAHVEKLKHEGHVVMMIGDGINDSPALAAADVSVAMADASDMARSVADILIQDSSLASVVTLRTLSTRLMERISADYRFIVGFNSLLIVLGLTGVITVTTAAYLHNLSTIGIAAMNTRPLLEGRELEAVELLEAASAESAAEAELLDEVVVPV